MRSGLLSLVVAAMLAAASAHPARAQIIRGWIVDASTQVPIPGAFIVLVDSAGTQRGEALAGSEGTFVLKAPQTGRYVLRAERIGYADTLSDTLDVKAGSTLTYRFEISARPVDLEGLKVTGKGRCRLSRDMGAETNVLWEEVRKALSIAVWGEKERYVPYQTLAWSRTRALFSLDILSDTMRVSSGYGRTPFASESARKLGSKGYIRSGRGGSYTFYGLDAQTLLSDDFLSTHCFRVREAGKAQKGLIGLAFQPLHKGGPPDIVGTLWVDRATAELRYLEFRYDKIPMPGHLSPKRFGGRMEFRRLGNGDWVVDHWWLRMPQSVVVTEAGTLVPGKMRIHEQGGEIRFIGTAGTAARRGRSTLRGVVFDSTRSTPLARADVFLTDINRATGTDFSGHFRFSDLPAGRHEVAFTAPYADSLGLAVTPRTVVVGPNHYASVTLAVPRSATCPATNPPTGGVLGFVESVRTGEPLPGAEARVTWWNVPGDKPASSPPKRVAITDTADAHGRYLFCGLPMNTQVALAATDGPSVVGPVVTLELRAPGLVRQELLNDHRNR